jgi:hypothetical protein
MVTKVTMPVGLGWIGDLDFERKRDATDGRGFIGRLIGEMGLGLFALTHLL